ncbi:MAG: hypothetical protein KDB53_00005, partial [Planctomycetes bacterium]|nr:hypothetical protein [Planctomycetota bacterium]
MNRTTRFSLGQRFYSALIILCVLGLLAWGLFVARRAGDDFERHARELVDRGVRQVEDLLVREAATRSDLMERAVGHLSDNLSRELEDIPFEVFERRQDLLVSFLRDRLEEGRRRNHANSVVIAGLIREASSARLRREIAQLEAQARADRDRQSRRVLRDMLAWGGSFLLGIGILVGLAFHHLVARPLRRASEVVDRMGQGELGERMSEQGADEIV